MKNKIIIKIISLVILIIFIIVLALLLINNSSKNSNNKKNPVNNEENEHIINLENTECTEKINWNGVFKNNNSTLKLYQKSETELNFEGEINNNYIYGTATNINKNKTIFTNDEVTYTFIICKDEVFLTTPNIKDMKLTRNSDYTNTDYYKEHFGDPKYLDSIFNGIFKNDKYTIKLYQKSDTEVSLTITGDFYYNAIIKIENNQIDYEETLDGYTQKIKININDNIMSLEMSDTYPGNTLHQINGTYPKESNYTIDQIILDNYNSKNSK